MTTTRYLVLSLLSLLLVVSVTAAGPQEFPWADAFNRRAEENLTAFKQRLSERFRADLGQVNRILEQARNPADAYLAFRLGELARRSPSDVLRNRQQGGGWGAVAKQLGIKPGSREFHDLKNRHDLDRGPEKSHKDGKGNKEGKGKGKNKN